ncbi:hypothetical protein VTP01DRAFT_294 [Rhizomucor pusillus]|uniref:uncharacterized protein n=1 Tax=Rhizomucor pusillus TaxID=4840 RepID=UPI0037435706
MSSQSYTMLPQTEASLQHILHHRELYLKDRKERGLPSRPFVVGVSGCQGSGKTTLCDTLSHLLRNSPHNLNVISFSLDDFYLTRSDQARLTAENPGNGLLQFRGQPGSHDLDLAQTTLNCLILANQEAARDKGVPISVLIPSYDKSLYGGLGDRKARSEWTTTYGPYDIILFEGWSQGFKPLPADELERVYREACAANEKGSCLLHSRLPQHSLAHLIKMNESLKQYEDKLYPFFDIFIHLSPAKLEQVYDWRLQQEHHMKETRKVDGMSDEAVRAFVDTYMPAYELYLPRLDRVGFYGQGLRGEPLQPYEGPVRKDGGYSGSERHLRLVLDPHRHVIHKQLFKELVFSDTKTATGSNSWKLSSRRFGSRSTLPKLLLSCTLVGLLGFIGYTRKQRIIDTFVRVTGGRK